jgi:anti-sigma factor RsiW
MIQAVTPNHFADDVLEEFALGRLDALQAAALERHLPVCPRCSERLAWLNGFAESIRSAATSSDAAARQRT